MMCSSWKISVFGIVALMLAFGLVTTDALADDQDSGQRHASDHRLCRYVGHGYSRMLPPSWTLADETQDIADG